MTPANIAGMAAVIGLDAIALTDHNTCRNCPAILAAAAEYGVTVLCGMELCTMEEVHVLCFFPNLTQALAFDRFVYENALLDIKNNPMLFGNQIIYNEQDEPSGTLDKLLISATSIPFSGVAEALKPYGGIMIPAHIDKGSNSLISNLGFIPPDSAFTMAEFHDITNKDSFIQRFPYLQNCDFLTSSDAHYLNDINEPIHFIEAKDNSAEAIFERLKGISKQ